MTLNCLHIFIVTGSFLYWCVMRPASQRFFIHSCIYLRILIISYLATFLGIIAFLCWCAVKQSINQSINQSILVLPPSSPIYFKMDINCTITDQLDYFSDIRNVTDSCNTNTAARAWDQVNGKSHYASLLSLIEHVFCGPAHLLLWGVCSVIEDCFLDHTEQVWAIKHFVTWCWLVDSWETLC